MSTDTKPSSIAGTSPFAGICGLVMPISEIDGCSEAHWLEVKDVLTEAAKNAGYEAKLVSESKTNVIIQKSIVQNLYQYPIVLCDVSAKNANVMFELGMRISFSKPTIVVKDDKTSYSFDTAPFRHIQYPRDMNHKKVMEFILALSENIKEVMKSVSDGKHEGYLTTFAAIESVTIETKNIPQGEYVVKSLKDIQDGMAFIHSRLNMISHTNRVIRNVNRKNSFFPEYFSRDSIDVDVDPGYPLEREMIVNFDKLNIKSPGDKKITLDRIKILHKIGMITSFEYDSINELCSLKLDRGVNAGHIFEFLSLTLEI